MKGLDFRILAAPVRDELEELVTEIWEAEQEIKAMRKAARLSTKKERLKELLMQAVPANDKGQHAVTVNDLLVKVYLRTGALKGDFNKAKELLHDNTLRAIFKRNAPSWVLDTIRETD